MTGYEPKDDLARYLTAAHEALLWKLEGLSEYDVRRPLTPTGTNLLGLVKHLASIEAGYLGDTFGRPFPEPLPWYGDGAEPEADMWVTADETRDGMIDLYRRVWTHSSATLHALELDAVGHVPWWPVDRREVTLHRVLVHVIAETNRHAGHADIIRESVDGAVGLRRDNDDLGTTDPAVWQAYHDRLESVAQQFR
jgi:uncharacterized damage-inducible protein DinB